MQYDTITYAVDDGVATITLNRPDVMNALNAQMRAELADAVARAGREARALVLTGAGRSFCSGQDLGDTKNIRDLDLQRTLNEEYVPLLTAIYECPIPTITAVNGAAAGAGANLALAADVVIATESAYFVQAFTKIGLIPDAGGTWYLPRQMGLAKAMGAALFAEKITARQADDWGMIWEAVADDAFADHIAKRAAHLANGPTLAYRKVKEAMRASFDNELGDQLALEAKLQGDCGKSRDFIEGVMAFLEKRPASYEGR
ncbi:MAG: enoyl-CoA hydratase/isomerase family protein [Pelagimonas sp.]